MFCKLRAWGGYVCCLFALNACLFKKSGEGLSLTVPEGDFESSVSSAAEFLSTPFDDLPADVSFSRLRSEDRGSAFVNYRFRFATESDFLFDPKYLRITNESISIKKTDQEDRGSGSFSFDGGSYLQNAFFDTNAQTLSLANRSLPEGEFVSRRIQFGGPVRLDEFSWLPNRPTGKELPDNKLSESGYPQGNLNMSSNILLFHFNEAENSTEFADSSGETDASNNTYVGACQGVLCPSREEPGKLGAAFSFSSSEINLGIHPKINTLGTAQNPNFTIAVWVKPSALGVNNEELIILSHQDDSRGFSFGMRNDFLIFDFLGERAFPAPQATVETNIWQHIAVVVQTGTGARFFVNGEFKQEVLFPDGVDVSSEDNFIIGAREADSHYFGSLDEVAIFETAFTDQSVEDLYLRGALNLRFQIKMCLETEGCATQPYLGPDGTANSFYSEIDNKTANPLKITFVEGRTAQSVEYRVRLDSSDASHSPQVVQVNWGPEHYFVGPHVVENRTPLDIVSITGLEESLGANHEGKITYQLSADGKTWYYLGPLGWMVATNSNQSNSLSELSQRLAAQSRQAGKKDLYFRAFLYSSDGNKPVELKSLLIRGNY